MAGKVRNIKFRNPLKFYLGLRTKCYAICHCSYNLLLVATKKKRGYQKKQNLDIMLYKVENQMHIHYGKGSVILYALQDYIGEDKVNTAMRHFLEEYKYRKPPYPNSLDFLRHLEPQVPDSLKYLINDWFKEITL